jgi:tripeptidyl-peptidase-1
LADGHPRARVSGKPVLGASYQLYRNTETNETIVRTVGYALPAVLHTHIEAVEPTTYFASTRVIQETPHRRSFGAAPADADAASDKLVTGLSSRAGQVMPSFLHWLYGTSSFVPVKSQNSLVVVGMSDQYPSPDDLYYFVDFYRSDAAQDAVFNVPWFNVVKLNDGGYNQDKPSLDPNIASVGGGKSLLPDGEPAPGDALLALLRYSMDLPTVPETISISYIITDEMSVPVQYATRLCYMFAQVGLRGVTILVASGSDGIGAGKCEDESGNVRFLASFPSTCTCDILTSSTQRRYKSLTRPP